MSATVLTDSVNCRIGRPKDPCTHSPATHHSCAGTVATAIRVSARIASRTRTSLVIQIMYGTNRAGATRTNTTELALVPDISVTTSAMSTGARQVRSRRAMARSPMSQGSAVHGRRMTEVLPK